jgi:hypothetical protein
MPKTDQYQKPASWEKTGNSLNNNIKIPKGTAANANKIQRINFKIKIIIFDMISYNMIAVFIGY